MHFISLLPATLLVLPLAASRSIHRRHDEKFAYKAVAASKEYPGIANMGASIEGASADASGTFYAVNQTSLVNLNTGAVLHSNTTGAFFASSRVLRNGDILLGDAQKKVLKISKDGKPIANPYLTNPSWNQPNDMALTADEKTLYFSGMIWAENLGDAWYAANDAAKPNHQQINTKDSGIKRTNGIELSPDEKTLYITSGENSAEKKTIGAKVYSIPLDPATKGPAKDAKWTVALDFYKVDQLNATDMLKADMDLDGMRIDIKGNMFSTLNAYKRVVRWNTKNPKDLDVILLDSVDRPTNLEFGGADGKTLIVVGKCAKAKPGSTEEEEPTKACVDKIKVPHVGRAWYALKNGRAPSSQCTAKKNKA